MKSQKHLEEEKKKNHLKTVIDTHLFFLNLPVEMSCPSSILHKRNIIVQEYILLLKHQDHQAGVPLPKYWAISVPLIMQMIKNILAIVKILARIEL